MGNTCVYMCMYTQQTYTHTYIHLKTYSNTQQQHTAATHSSNTPKHTNVVVYVAVSVGHGPQAMVAGATSWSNQIGDMLLCGATHEQHWCGRLMSLSNHSIVCVGLANWVHWQQHVHTPGKTKQNTHTHPCTEQNTHSTKHAHHKTHLEGSHGAPLVALHPWSTNVVPTTR